MTPDPTSRALERVYTNAELLRMFADVICPKLRDTLVPYGASATNWDSVSAQLRRIAAFLPVSDPGDTERLRGIINELQLAMFEDEEEHTIILKRLRGVFKALRADAARSAARPQEEG